MTAAEDLESVRAQVQRVLHSRTFETSETHRRLLTYLFEKSVSGEADRLKEYTIGVEAFGKPQTYDPQSDSIVRNQASRLRQKLLDYYHAEGRLDPIVLDLPKGGFRLVSQAAPARDPAPVPAERLAPADAAVPGGRRLLVYFPWAWRESWRSLAPSWHMGWPAASTARRQRLPLHGRSHGCSTRARRLWS